MSQSKLQKHNNNVINPNMSQSKLQKHNNNVINPNHKPIKDTES